MKALTTEDCVLSTTSVALTVQKKAPAMVALVTHKKTSATMALSSLEIIPAAARALERAVELRRVLASRLGTISFVQLSEELEANFVEENTYMRQTFNRPVAGRLTFMDLTESDIILNELYSGILKNYRFSTIESTS